MIISRLFLHGGLLGATLVSAGTTPATKPVPAITPAQWLKSRPKPAFKANHIRGSAVFPP